MTMCLCAMIKHYCTIYVYVYVHVRDITADDFSGQHAGYICLHSLKNPTFPE